MVLVCTTWKTITMLTKQNRYIKYLYICENLKIRETLFNLFKISWAFVWWIYKTMKYVFRKSQLILQNLILAGNYINNIKSKSKLLLEAPWTDSSFSDYFIFHLHKPTMLFPYRRLYLTPRHQPKQLRINIYNSNLCPLINVEFPLKSCRFIEIITSLCNMLQ